MYNIPQELVINLDNHQNNVLKKDKLIETINSYNNINFLEFYKKSIEVAIERNPLYNIDDVKDILNACSKQINKLKGVDNVVNSFKEIKSQTTKFDNISIICSPKEINDKTLENVRKDVYYIKININGINELYEVNNKDKFMNIINNIELLKNMSEQELINMLTSKEISTKLQTKEMNTKDNKSITVNYIKEEVNNIYDTYVRNVFENNIDNVIKERMDLNEYIKKNMPEEKVEYALNSNGERIYMVKDKIIKFVGEERNMYFLSENGDNIVNTVSFEQYQNSSNNNDNELKEYKDNPDLIRSSLYLLFENGNLTLEQKENAINFLRICIENEEKGKSNYEMQEIFDEYYNYAKENNIYPDERIREIFDRKDKLKNNKEHENSNKLNNPHIKKLILEDNYKGFIATTIILESALALVLIISLIMLFR